MTVINIQDVLYRREVERRKLDPELISRLIKCRKTCANLERNLAKLIGDFKELSNEREIKDKQEVDK